MSRCFPYMGVVVRKGETPAEPIKLQKERLRNHGTEKRNHIKRKESENTFRKCRGNVVRGRTIVLVTNSSQAKKFGEGGMSDGKKESDCMMRISKSKEDSCESGVSEEHGQPISPTSIFSLSDASKREEHKAASQPFVEKRGSVIRIRLKSHKQPVPEPTPAELPAIQVSTSTTDSPTFEGHSEAASTSSQYSLEPVAVASHSIDLLPDPELQYASYLDQWVPAPLNFDRDSPYDLDWILGPKQSGEKCPKRLKPADEGWLPYNTCASFSRTPSENYLPEAEIHALPYVSLL